MSDQRLLNHTIYGELIHQTGGCQVYRDGRDIYLVQGSQYVCVENADQDEIIEALSMARNFIRKNQP
jgi:hypothetical protein